MYIRRVMLENIKGFRGRHELDFGDGDLAGWWVLAGRNGAGKTTALRGAALSLVGEQNAAALIGSGLAWRSKDCDDLSRTVVHTSDVPKVGKVLKFKAGGGDLRGSVKGSQRHLPVVGLGTDRHSTRDYDPRRWAPEAERVASLFGLGGVADPIEFLQFQHAKALEGDELAEELRDGLLALLNSGLLPDGAVVKRVDTKGLWIQQAGIELPLDALPDGFRAAIVLVAEVARRLYDITVAAAVHEAIAGSRADTSDKWPWQTEAVVLIDEVESHLHVSWQQRIGAWLCKHFPRVQFIVTTHSPFVCQSVVQDGQVRGGLFRLPASGAEERIARIEGNEFWMVAHGGADEAVMTSLFGLDHPYSTDAERHRQSLGALQRKLIDGNASEEELARYKSLQEQAPPPGMAQLQAAIRELKAAH